MPTLPPGYFTYPPPEVAFYPEDYGAIGDGVADDTTYIQAAIDAAEINGGIVWLNNTYGISYTGTFRLRANDVPYGVHINANNVFVMGSGTVIPITADIAYNIFLIGNGGAAEVQPGELGTWTENVGFFGITIDGNSLATTAQVTGFRFDYCKGFFVEQTRVLGLTGRGIGAFGTVRDGRIVNNIVIEKGGISHNIAGIHLDGGSHCIVSGNYVHQVYSIGINLQANNDNGAAGTPKYNQVCNNTVYDPYSIGIILAGVSYSIISNNYIYDGATEGLRFCVQSNAGSYKAECSYNSITGNYLMKPINAAIAIRIYGEDVNVFDGTPLPAQHNYIAGNMIDEHWTTKFDLGEQSNHNFITDNICDTPGTLVADDATPSVSAGFNVYRTANVNPTTITMLDDGFVEQRVTVIINDALTTIDFTGTNLKGNVGVDWSPSSGDHMDCVFDGTNWYCIVSDDTA